MDPHLSKKITFLIISLLLLLSGLMGIQRLLLRPGGQFRWENRADKVAVAEVMPGGVAQKAGLRKGDLILKVDGQPITKSPELEFLLDNKKAGQQVSFLVQRKNKKFLLSLNLVPRYNVRFVIINLLLGLFFWAVGIFVLWQKPNKKDARIFYWGCMTIAVAIILLWPGSPTHNGFTGYFLPVLYFLLYPLTPALILYFTILYPEEKRFLQRYPISRTLIFLPSIAFILSLEISYLFSLHSKSLAYFNAFYHLYNGFRAYFIAFLALSVVSLIHSYKKSRTKESRNKVQWILWGICVGITPFFLLWTLPQVLGFPPLIAEEITYLFLMIIPLTFAFSIVKYQAMDIEVIINRSIVYTVLSGIIVLIYLLLVGMSGYFFHSVSSRAGTFIAIICTLIAAVLFAPLKQQIQTFVDKNFYRVKYNYRLAIMEFGQALGKALTPSELPDLIIEKMNDAIPVEKIALLVKDPRKEIFTLIGSRGVTGEEEKQFRLSFNDKLVATIRSQRVPFAKRGSTELKQIGEIPADSVWDKTGIEIIIPVFLQDNLKGFLFLGKKRSGTRYSEEDLELLIPMAEEGMMAFERLQLQEMMILEQQEKKKLEELNRLKSEFLSHVSHELRTPLSSIYWSVTNLLDGIPEKPSPGVREYLTGICENTRHLERMIYNLLNITRIEAGKIEIHPEVLNLSREIEKSVDTITPLAREKDIRLKMAVNKNLQVQTDRDCLKTILTNLIENAIKYSPAGSTVQVEAKIAGGEVSGQVKGAGKSAVEISVIDEGEGIPVEKQKVIFDRFERVRTAKTAGEKGLGLGLHIVKKLVERQGGSIRVTSEVGKGSTFTFTLPGEVREG